jgi:hypothetical protein
MTYSASYGAGAKSLASPLFWDALTFPPFPSFPSFPPF